jgi:hypothetical protein
VGAGSEVDDGIGTALDSEVQSEVSNDVRAVMARSKKENRES